MTNDPVDHEASAVAQMANQIRDEEDGRAMEALERLAAVDDGLAQLVELRFFGGLELEEIAGLNGRSERSLKRDWRKARAFLHAQLAGLPDGDD